MQTGPLHGIKLVNLYYNVGAKPLFQSLNAILMPGIVAITGANGCGKSTLLRILSGTCQPHQGKVLFQQQDVYQNPRQIKHLIGYAPTQPFLYSHLTVLENLQVVAHLRSINSTLKQEHLLHVLDKCTLLGYQKMLFGKLSDGLKKRAMVASLLVHQPPLLILDEPCAGLDPLQRKHLWDLLAQLRHPEQLIIFSSHHPQEISSLCDKMYELNQGQLQNIIQHNEFSHHFLEGASRKAPISEQSA